MTKLGLAQEIINEMKPQFNDFKRTIDRKYALYEVLRYRDKPYEIHKYVGSNQIIVKDHKGVTIYNSDEETKEQKTNFEQWFKKILITLILINLPQ